jgi:sugar/nucleoside kinase (ribokinase family)
MATNSSHGRRVVFDLIGIGALNLDHIVGRSAAMRLDAAGRAAGVAAAFSDPCAPVASLDAMQDLMAQLEPFAVRCPGGSAFNVVQAMAAARRDVHLGVVGVLARRQAAFDEWLPAHHVDGRFVIPIHTDDPGLCASLTSDAGQRFKCFPGANLQFATAVGAAFDAVVDYLRLARVVFISPLFDDAAAQTLRDLVVALRLEPEGPLICFDPGPCWSRMPSATVRELCHAADVLFVDEAEWRSLAGVVQDRELGRLVTVVVKEPGATVVLQRHHRHDWDKATYPIHRLLPPSGIEDATGAGDIFAAGFLIGGLLGRSQAWSVELGHRLMRVKLLGVGTSRHHRFARVYQRWAAKPATSPWLTPHLAFRATA